VGFCPLQAVSLLSKVSTVALCGSVAGRLKAPPLSILPKAYFKCGTSTTVRKSQGNLCVYATCQKLREQELEWITLQRT
jgi:hypothetical protein